jgi:hypothetical protein
MAPALPKQRGLARTALALALIAAALVAVAAGCGCGQARSGAPLALGSVSQLPRSPRSHVVVLVMENAEYGEVIGSKSAPYVNALARRYALATQSFSIAHPSLPNYLALTSGSTHGISSDCTSCSVSATNIVDQLEGRGISWKAYLEDVPTSCFRGAGAGGYAKKHNPFIYYEDIARSPARCAKLVGFAQLAADLRSGRLPSYAWISPNLCDDGHDCGVSAGDRFLARTVPALLRALGPHGFLAITWDEGVSDRGCCGAARGGHIATVLAGAGARLGAHEARPVDHYGVLATIERALGLPPLAGAADSRAGSLAPLLTPSGLLP